MNPIPSRKFPCPDCKESFDTTDELQAHLRPPRPANIARVTSMHVDDFIDQADEATAYARFVLHHFRLPALQQAYFLPFTKQFRLFCDYEGLRYRVTGASRLGDVCLATDFDRETGYNLRVDPARCSNWAKDP